MITCGVRMYMEVTLSPIVHTQGPPEIRFRYSRRSTRNPWSFGWMLDTDTPIIGGHTGRGHGIEAGRVTDGDRR